jgi:hypothetical protein
VAEKEAKLRRLVAAGSQITGSTAGSAIGFLIGGPGGAALGGAAGAVLSTAIAEFSNRVLSDREQVRVGATAFYAIERIRARLGSGYELRQDGFFGATCQGRSDAEEVFEGVLLKAKNEHEEKKTQILGNIFANIAFMPGFSAAQANHLLRIAEALTYRQMCILALVERKHEVDGVRLKTDSYGYPRELHDPIAPHEVVSLLQEAFDLCRQGLLVNVDADTMHPNEVSIVALTEWNEIAPDGLALTRLGLRFYQAMGLDDLPTGDLRSVARRLS